MTHAVPDVILAWGRENAVGGQWVPVSAPETEICFTQGGPTMELVRMALKASIANESNAAALCQIALARIGG